jgi:hypothetical protein
MTAQIIPFPARRSPYAYLREADERFRRYCMMTWLQWPEAVAQFWTGEIMRPPEHVAPHLWREMVNVHVTGLLNQRTGACGND